MSYKRLYSPLLLAHPPKFIAPSVASLNDLLSLYDTMRMENGLTLFLIRIYTIENITRKLVNDEVLTVINDASSPITTYTFSYFPLRSIYRLIRFSRRHSFKRSRITNSRNCPSMYTCINTLSTNWLHYEVFREVIPNFPLTINKWEIPHWGK